jgi:hypothetical protein
MRYKRILSDEVLKAAAAEPQKTDGHGEFPDAARAGKLPNVLPFILFDEINVTPKAWLAKDFLGAGEMSCWYGHPGDGKSVLVEDFGLHVAAHMPWHDREVLGGAVLYIALERVQLVKRRAWPSRSSTMSPAFPCTRKAERPCSLSMRMATQGRLLPHERTNTMNLMQRMMRPWRTVGYYRGWGPYMKGITRRTRWRDAWAISGMYCPIPEIFGVVDRYLPGYCDDEARVLFLDFLISGIKERRAEILGVEYLYEDDPLLRLPP